MAARRGRRLDAGVVVQSATVRASGLREADIAEKLGELAKQFKGVSLGSYPWFRSPTDHGVALVARSGDDVQLADAKARLEDLIRAAGKEPETLEGEPT